MIFEILFLLVGILLLIFLSPYVVKYSTKLGELLNISPLIIGIIAIAIGTSIPEISNSVTSSLLGHGDINVGDTVGSSLSQITLILGLSVLISGPVRTERKNMFLLGSGMIIATLIAFSIIEKGYVSRLNGLLLIVTYIALYYVIGNSLTKPEYVKQTREQKGVAFSSLWKKYTLYLGLSIFGIIIGSLLVVNSVIGISEEVGIDEYLISFIAVGLGTSLPELFVGINAIKKGEHELFIGDIIGSNITDVTLSLGTGAMLRPNIITSDLIIPTGSYLVLISIIVVLIFGIRKKIDRKMGALLIGLYLLSYVII